MRKDGQRNRQRLLDAAEALFARKGTTVGVAEIVAAAGVSPPTLYRHFSNKEALIAALAERRAEEVAANLARALSQPTGWDGLRVALELSVDLARRNRAVREQQTGLPLAPALERMLLAGWVELVERAQAEGAVRPDFTGADLPFVAVAVVAAALAADHEPHLPDRYITLIMDGLRPHGPAVLPGPPPSPRSVTRAFSREDSPTDH